MPEALTLPQYAERAWNKGRYRDSEIALQFAEEAPILEVIPVMTTGTLSYTYRKQEKLPGVAYRGVNGSYKSSTGVVNPQTETYAIGGGDADCDTELVDGPDDDVRKEEEEAQIRAMALKAQKTIIKGDTTTDPFEFDGLQRRLTGTQLISPGTTATGDALSLSILTKARFLCRRPTHWIMNRTMAERITQAANDTTISNLQWPVNSFGQPIVSYSGLPILILEEDNEGNEVLDFNESNPRAGSASPGSTSIYCVSFRRGHLFMGQKSPIRARDLGEVDDKPAYRTRIDWSHSIIAKDGRSGVRISGIADRKVVSG